MRALRLCAGLAFPALAVEPVGIRSQFMIGVSALAGMRAIRAPRLTGVRRQIFLALGAAPLAAPRRASADDMPLPN